MLKNKHERITMKMILALSDVKYTKKVFVIKTVWHWYMHTSRKNKESPETDPSTYRNLVYEGKLSQIPMAKTAFQKK